MRKILAIVCMCFVGLALVSPAGACDFGGVQAVTVSVSPLAAPVQFQYVAPVSFVRGGFAPAFTAYSPPVAFVNAHPVRERIIERVREPRRQRIKRGERIRVR